MEPEGRLIGHTGAVTGITELGRSGGNIVLATCGDTTLRIWDASTGRSLHTFPLGFVPVTVSASAGWLAAGGKAGLVVLGGPGRR